MTMSERLADLWARYVDAANWREDGDRLKFERAATVFRSGGFPATTRPPKRIGLEACSSPAIGHGSSGQTPTMRSMAAGSA